MWIAVSVVLFVALVVAVAMLWSVYRIRKTNWGDVPALERGPQFERMVARLTLDTLAEGNRMKLLHDGDGFFPALIEAFEAADHSIHFETFLWKTGKVSASLVDVLVRRANPQAFARRATTTNAITASSRSSMGASLFPPQSLRTFVHRSFASREGLSTPWYELHTVSMRACFQPTLAFSSGSGTHRLFFDTKDVAADASWATQTPLRVVQEKRKSRSWPSRLPLRRLDYVLTKERTQVTEHTVLREGFRRASDHLPVRVKLRMQLDS